MADFLKELWAYMRVRKKYWILPIVLLMGVLGAVVVYTQGSAFLPFVYSFF